MTLRSLHRIHRWIAIPTGVFIVGWIISGVAPMVPSPGPRPILPQPLDLSRIAVTPAEAARAVAGNATAVMSMRLHLLGDVPAYEIVVAGRGSQLVDARTGRLFTVDAGLAQRMAEARAPAGAQIAWADLISRRRHDVTYSWGSLPAHRVAFDDAWATVVYVGIENGAVQTTTRWSRVMGIIAGFHTFNPLDLVVPDPAIRKAVLIAIALTALVTALTGYTIVAWRQRGA